jgi:hypothetical protein
MDYEKIKQDKIQEANDFYEMIGLKTYNDNLTDTDFNPFLPEVEKEINPLKEVEYHWTRLSINSNIGCIAE